MNIHVNALQSLPEVGTSAPSGLLPKVCPGKTKIICNQPTCKSTNIIVGLD